MNDRRNMDQVRVVCLGETMLMLAPPAYETLEHSEQYVAYNGGAESNVAIGLERLGIHAGWIGKLPDNALGHKLVNQIRAQGVDTRAVVWSPGGRVGTFFVEWGAPPRPLRTIYDRAGSAASTLEADELNWDYIAHAEWLVLTGITPALSDVCFLTTSAVAQRATQLGVKIAFDVNYRALLWDPPSARAALAEILPSVHLLVGTESDLRLLHEDGASREEILSRLVTSYGLDAAVMTLGSEGCLAYGGQRFLTAEAYAVQTVNRLGAGDAFLAGLLYGYLTLDLDAGLHYGMAMSALKLTIPQNIPLVRSEDVVALVAGRAAGDVLR
ncbi:MAG: sugar kinase [Anaerolineae bacterium]